MVYANLSGGEYKQVRVITPFPNCKASNNFNLKQVWKGYA